MGVRTPVLPASITPILQHSITPSLMRRSFTALLLVASLLLIFPRPAAHARADAAAGPLHFRVTLAPAIAANGASGRLFVLMSDSPRKQAMLETGFVPGETWLAAMEVR